MDIPQEFQEVLQDQQLQEAIKKQPGSRRFKAMVLGLAALQYVKDRARGDSEPEVEE